MSDSPAPHETDDFVPEDDAVIGRALRRSAIALVVILGAVLAVVLLKGSDETQETVHDKDAGSIEDFAANAEQEAPRVLFTDVSLASGIDFEHEDGAQGDKLLPETMGGGAAFLDYDGDGDQDLLFVNGANWPEDGGNAPGNRLFENDGSGHFTDVSASSGLAGSSYGMGVAVGDYDGDGQVDVFTTGVGFNHLYRNEGGTFRDVTEAAGVAGEADQWTTSAGFFDADGDGDLDLFVCRYVTWSRAIDEQLAFTNNGIDRVYGSPKNYGGTHSSLYRNEGDGSFTDVSEEAGIPILNEATGVATGKALGVVFVDVDSDGDTDLMVANDTVQNFLFLNSGTGIFEEVGSRRGVGFNSDGNATGAMGIDVADYRDDGCLGICIGNFANEMSSLYVAPPGKTYFSDDAIGEGIGSPSRQKLSFGLFFFDYDLDGRLDLLQVNGHLEETIHEMQPSQEYLQTPQLFWNAGPNARSRYRVVAEEETGDLGHKLAGRGSAYADVDQDGDLDVVVVQVGRRPLLLRNDQDLGHHWLRVRLVGQAPNTAALGAWVELRSAGRTLRRLVSATKSYLSQSELPVTFGLGAEDSIESLRVIWPDGTLQEVPVPTSLDRELVVRRQE